jgi:putative tryptophan/tyrosine transport system substrate-binding protein
MCQFDILAPALAGGDGMQFDQLKRRDFITLIGGAAAAWPLAARAQQPERMRRIGFLHGLAEDDPEAQARIGAFREALAALGWIEGRNISIDYRFAGGDPARAEAIVADVVGSAPDLIVAHSTSWRRSSRPQARSQSFLHC